MTFDPAASRMARIPADGADPELSVVMVSHGAWELTERAICALVEHTDRPFELIVVDNASDGETRGQLTALRNARVLLNDENRGFGPATNQGAAEARSSLLLLLNTDAFVHSGWLEPLLEALDEPSAGAAVPRYLNPDGSLQEAGALLARDGTVMPYGAGEDPELPSFRFRRSVDYGSAACMLLRREDFVARGGFDERYAPAYYEDVDLCLRLAQDGLGTLYEPSSIVTHAGGGSDEPASAVRLSERNHKRFVERWGPALVGRPWTLVNASEQAVISARDALATPRVLVRAGPDEPGAGRLLEALLDGWPRARITWVPGGEERGELLERGVELAPHDDAGWLGERLFHYDLIVHGEGDEPHLIGETQPQAPRLNLAESHELAAALAAAGVAPQRR